MADINVERKGPSIWPWIIGLLVLALLIWAIAEMVDTEEPEVAVVEEVEQPPAAVPAPMPDTAAATLGTLLPLGPEDVGRPVLLAGEVVGTAVAEGFWLKSDEAGDHVLFVKTPTMTRDGRTLESTDIQTGQRVEIVGSVQQIPPNQAVAWIDRTELRNVPEFGDWNVHQDLMVGTAPVGTQPMPGAQHPGTQREQPGDTVQGRY